LGSRGRSSGLSIMMSALIVLWTGRKENTTLATGEYDSQNVVFLLAVMIVHCVTPCKSSKIWRYRLTDQTGGTRRHRCAFLNVFSVD
jgi:hypothetical protein